MKNRCFNVDGAKYPIYGGRGIKVCERWLHSFETFLTDVGRKPSPAHSIDRINVNGNYEPGNVRWSTSREQSRNTRDSIYITYRGETHHLKEWAGLLGIGYNTIYYRITHGWTPERTLATPTRIRLLS